MLPNETDCSGFEKTMNQYCAEVTRLTKILLHAISRSVVKAKGQISSSGYNLCVHFVVFGVSFSVT